MQDISVLVTGGAGFIGSHLVDHLLKSNAKVTVLDDLSTGSTANIVAFKNEKNFTFIEGDIRNIDTCLKAAKGQDYILHQAALGSVPRSIKDPITSNEVNVSGFLNILQAARECNVKRIVYAASSSTYGDSKKLPKVEENIGKPLSPYAVTKYVNELYADVFAKTYGMELIGLRYFNVFGPRQNPQGPYAAVIPLFIQAALENKAPVIHGDGLQTRDFTFVNNVVQANFKAMLTKNKEAINQVYNVACGDRTTLLDTWNSISEITETESQPEYTASRTGDVRDSMADTSKAHKLLNYTPTIKLHEGLKMTIDWYRQNRGL